MNILEKVFWKWWRRQIVYMDISSYNVFEHQKLCYQTFAHKKIKGAKFIRSDFTESVFINYIFEECVFDQNEMRSAIFSNCMMINCTINKQYLPHLDEIVTADNYTTRTPPLKLTNK